MTRNNHKKTIIFSIIAIVCIYAALAVIETKNLSSKTVYQAFEKFSHDEFTKQQQGKILDPVFYQEKNTAFVPFIIGNDIALTQFDKGLFGWKQSYYSRDRNEAFSYSTSVVDDRVTLYHGSIPSDITGQTHAVKINDKEAKILKLNQDVKVWILANVNDREQDDDNVHIDFLDEDGAVIRKE